MQYRLIKSCFFLNAFFIFALAVRQFTLEDTISPILVASQFFLLLIICCGIRNIRLQPIEIFLFLLLFASLLKSDFDLYDVRNIGVDFAKPLIFIATIASIRSKNNSIFVADKSISHIFSYYYFTTLLSIFAGFYYYYLVDVVYFAFSSIYSVIGYFYLVRKSKNGSLLYMASLALSGKRAVFASALTTHLVVSKAFSSKMIFALFFLIISIAALLSGSDLFMAIISEHLLKLDLKVIYTTSDHLSLFKFITGGRLDELIDGLSYELNVSNVMFGQSLGYTYDSPVFGEANHKNFHFTPASIFVNYGLVFTLAFAYYIIRIPMSADVKSYANCSANVFVLRMFVISSFFFFLTEFGVFSYINFCVALGLLSGVPACDTTNLSSSIAS